MRSHRETSQYRVEELQALRWKVFSREEIHSYQSKVPHTTAVDTQSGQPAVPAPLACVLTQLSEVIGHKAEGDGSL